VATKCADSGPKRLERTEAQLAVEVEARRVDAFHVLLAMRGNERVVRVGRLPAIDDEIPSRCLDVVQELGADIAAPPAEELRPLAVRAEDALELRGVAHHLVAEDECDHAPEDKVRAVSAEAVPAEPESREEYAGVLRFYHLAKHQEWQVDEVPWGEIPFVPEGKGTPERRARRRDIWRSVIMQQLQADVFACEMASQLLSAAPDPEAKLYYSTMVQDESRHTEAWLRLIGQVGGEGERDPYLDQLAHMFLEADLLEEKVFLMQVFFERLIIPRFRLIARSSRGTVLEDLCNRLAIDDGIHHGAGMAYERVLLQSAGKKVRAQLVDAANTMLPIFANHVLWRPKVREMIGTLMEARDRERLREELNHGVRLANSLGLDVSDVRLPAG
jgi:1,2-phenylacetyl-CoA epoxidase catalytic subunit